MNEASKPHSVAHTYSARITTNFWHIDCAPHQSPLNSQHSASSQPNVFHSGTHSIEVHTQGRQRQRILIPPSHMYWRHIHIRCDLSQAECTSNSQLGHSQSGSARVLRNLCLKERQVCSHNLVYLDLVLDEDQGGHGRDLVLHGEFLRKKWRVRGSSHHSHSVSP